MRYFLIILTVMCSLTQQSTAQEFDTKHAVILSYDQIGPASAPATSLNIETFQDHLRELTSGPYVIRPLPDIVESLQNGHAIPPYTVALTFDNVDDYFFNYALPVLQDYDIPYTLFIAPKKLSDQNWEILKKIIKNEAVRIGLHPNITSRSDNWADAVIRSEINSAKVQLRQNLGIDSLFFAYPYGVYDIAYRNIVERSGFEAAFGQQSGAASVGMNLMTLPRFTMTDRHGSLDRLNMVASSLPLNADDIQPQNPKLTTPHPAIGFTLAPEIQKYVQNMRCFVSGQPKPQMDVLDGGRIEIRLSVPLEQTRVRVNCTMPSGQKTEGNKIRWRWLGLLLTVPESIILQQDALPELPEHNGEAYSQSPSSVSP